MFLRHRTLFHNLDSSFALCWLFIHNPHIDIILSEGIFSDSEFRLFNQGYISQFPLVPGAIKPKPQETINQCAGKQ
jgi:hypothetical protein